ncbi:farnesylcysteine lyase [Nymphaea colorata]|nr:farnesylcysteine lyase [Nymphaea colorata]
MAPWAATLLITSLLLLLSSVTYSSSFSRPHRICIIGSGIAGSSAAHFLHDLGKSTFSPNSLPIEILIFEKRGRVGGRMATVSIGGDTFEAGGTILHPKNFHALNFTSLLNLSTTTGRDDDGVDDGWFGIWDGERFVLETIPQGKSFISKQIARLWNTVTLFRRYGFSLIRMQRFVQGMLESFLRYYEKDRPVFSSVEEMLKWAGLYSLTQRTLREELDDAGLSSLLISELVTVITRINYGQDVSISGLAGAVSLAGSGGGLWSVEGGNWQLAAGLINNTNASLHLHEEIVSVSNHGDYYELNSTQENSYHCEVALVATPLDEVRINFSPPVTLPKRSTQHTYATFVRGFLNPEYFGLSPSSEIPDLVATLEVKGLPFSSVSVLKRYSDKDKTYKIFSRAPISDELLDKLFSVRSDTRMINWPAYPHYVVPEVFAPFMLDQSHLYYINAFESAASTIETSAVAAENVARLILSRLSSSAHVGSRSGELQGVGPENLHVDL